MSWTLVLPLIFPVAGAVVALVALAACERGNERARRTGDDPQGEGTAA